MSGMWVWIILASVAAFGLKFAGYLIPERLLQNEDVYEISQFVTAGLLAALVVTNTFASGQSLALDARVFALLAAVTALSLRAPFIVVVIAGAAAAALARFLGMA